MLDKDILESVLKKFLADPRHPKYMDLPENFHLQEENKQIYLSSAWRKSHWSYKKYKSTIKQMAAGRSYFCCNLSYQIAVKNGLKKKTEIVNEMTESDFDITKWKVEMEGFWLGEAENAFFDNDSISACRKLEKVIYPSDVQNLCSKDVKRTYKKKDKNEIRVLFADIALMASKGSKRKNDASCFGLMCLTENSSRSDYLRDFPYIESWTGQHSEMTALRLRKLFEEFECDYMVLDTMGVGLPIFDLLSGTPMEDKETGVEYYPLGCMNDDDMNARCLYPNNPKVIYSIKASEQFNNDMAIMLQNAIRSRKVRFLVDENDGQAYLTKFSGYDDYSGNVIGKLKAPYAQTTLAIYEMLALEYEQKENGKVKVFEKAGKRKDRYSALGMANYFADELARMNLKQKNQLNDDDDYVMYFE